MNMNRPTLLQRVSHRNLKLIAVLSATMLTFMACTIGGTTASSPPGTPGCTGGIATSCVTAAWWSSVDETVGGSPVTHVLPSQPMGVWSNIGYGDTAPDNVTLTCNSDCVSESGFIGNYVALLAGNLNNFIEVGYRADGAMGGAKYLYWADYPNGGMVAYHDIGSTGSSANNFNFMAYAVQLPGPTTGYSISLQALSGNTVLSSYSPSQAEESTNIFSGGPKAIEVGQVLHGQHGEAAQWELFASPNYATSPLFTPPVGTAPGVGLFPGTVTNNGYVTAASPPFGNFFFPPSSYPGDPGLFDISCCVTP